MAILRSYSATFEQNDFAQAGVARYRFNEGSGAGTALDSIDALDGSYEPGAAPGAAGSIGDGAASFDGTGFVLVDTLSGTITVSAFGDSEIAGGDIPNAADRFVPNLEAALEARGLDATVLDNGLGGRRVGELGDARLNDGIDVVGDVIAQNPDVVIVELGTNDALNTRPLNTVETNLGSIVSQLDAAGIEVLLTGTFGFYPERNGGTGYATADDRSAFEALFRSVASNSGVELLEDTGGSDKFLGGERIEGDPATSADDVIQGGVLGDPNLQAGGPGNPDGLHPNAAGVDLVVERVVPQTIALGAAAGVVDEPLLLANGSLEFWFTADSVSGEHALVAKNSAGQGTGGQFAILVRDGGRAFFALGDGENDHVISAPGVVAAGEPTHLVATFGADGMHLFVNGVEVGSDPYTGGLDAGLGNFELLAIGAETGGSTPGTVDSLVSFFQGTIDEFAVYDRGLTTAEVQELFDAGAQGSTLIGTADADTIIGGSDAEDLRGAGGDDIINGNDGDDTLRGGGGVDIARGGQGDDRFLGGGGADVLLGGPGNDHIRGMGGHDRIVGGGGNDLLRGEGGRDTLTGTGGADELFGGRAIDSLSGGSGEDLLNGGPGRDRLNGGPGSDTFEIDSIRHGLDRIFDFEDGVGGDVLDLSAVLNFGENDNLDDFVTLAQVNGNTNVDVDPNGGGDDFTTVFRLVNTSGLDINQLVNDGNIDLGTPTS